MNEICRVYITKNSISPFVAMIGNWPSRSKLFISCKAGFNVCNRIASDYEQSILDDAIRHPAIKYSSLLSLIRDQKYKLSKDHFVIMMKELRESWPIVREVIAISEKRKSKK